MNPLTNLIGGFGDFDAWTEAEFQRWKSEIAKSPLIHLGQDFEVVLEQAGGLGFRVMVIDIGSGIVRPNVMSIQKVPKTRVGTAYYFAGIWKLAGGLQNVKARVSEAAELSVTGYGRSADGRHDRQILRIELKDLRQR